MTFEEIFRVPKNHTLRQVNLRQKGALAQDDYWTHDELDENGAVVAKYESWHCTSIGTLKTNSGFKKFDAKGTLLEESDELPI